VTELSSTPTAVEMSDAAAERAALSGRTGSALPPGGGGGDGGVDHTTNGTGTAAPGPPTDDTSSTTGSSTTTSETTTTSAPATTTTGPSTTEPPPPGETDQVVDRVNAIRADVGCDPLTVDERLTTAAQLHSEDMSARSYMDHVTPEGLDPGDRAAAQGYTGPVGENVAMGYPTVDAVMEGWMGSPGHRENIENCDYVVIGVGFDPDGSYWTQMFGL
jgi:uncharacterized protein YkwD